MRTDRSRAAVDAPHAGPSGGVGAGRADAGRPQDPRALGVVTAAALLLMPACRGPQMTVESTGPVYVDGVRAETGVPRPFAYYGTTSLDALPDDDGQRPDWTKVPSRTLVTTERPVSAWLFPLDLPIELLMRPFAGPEDRTVTVSPMTTASQVTVGFQPEGLEPLRTRAFAARAAR